MASQALPVRGARLGRAIGAGTGSAVRAAVLVLPAGSPVSTRRRSPVAAAAALPLARRLVRAGRTEGLVAHIVHYRFRGWNGGHAHPAADAEWAVDEVVRRYGDVPVCLAGVDMGARAALRAAGHPAVNSVVALAPWLPPSQEAQEPEPVRHLVGRHVLIAHGTDDGTSDPDLSYRFAERAKKVNPNVCRFEVHSDGHSLHQHRTEVFALAADFTLGTLCGRAFARPVTDALAAPPPLGLRMPLAVGFGR
ncbi:alpha/beta hydrolase [Streptomyces sp. RB6PN25]|uniref:Alpha/beta hydrolase n=1 Tax=Streptomyces humicola TaxID=2953240 RepID=A0ABT1PXZ2_9ACTN|nr:alpha/beta hydrolase [Streptomyces humicola]MCQ4082509.1 alpha/beta hydrolase [Streptomyces humicola]